MKAITIRKFLHNDKVVTALMENPQSAHVPFYRIVKGKYKGSFVHIFDIIN